MGTTVRSVFGRMPLAVPPPVVCWVIPIGIIDDVIIIIGRILHSTTRWNPNGYVLTTFELKFTGRDGPLTGTGLLKGEFWLADLVPAQPINPINDEPLPMPYPPTQEIPFALGEAITISTGTRRYDEVVSFRVMKDGTILGHKYLDLGKLSRKE